jgi:hypothetical protein
MVISTQPQAALTGSKPARANKLGAISMAASRPRLFTTM